MTMAFVALLMGSVTDRNMFLVSWMAEGSSNRQKTPVGRKVDRGEEPERQERPLVVNSETDPWITGLCEPFLDFPPRGPSPEIYR